MSVPTDFVGAVCNAVSVHPNDRLLCVVSFDGVLAEYGSDPNDAEVTPARMSRLRRVHQIPGAVIAIISGRGLDDLRARIDLGEDAYYIGLHGLEIVGPGYVLSCDDVSKALQEPMDEVARRVRRALGDVPGVRLECKGPILALHTHNAAADDVVWARFQLLGAAAELVNSGVVRALRGHDVLELLPNVGSSRADALRAVQTRVAALSGESVFTVYVGGDLADDDFVRATHEHGVAAVVGQRTHTAYHIEPGQIDPLLEELIASRLAT